MERLAKNAKSDVTWIAFALLIFVSCAPSPSAQEALPPVRQGRPGAQQGDAEHGAAPPVSGGLVAYPARPAAAQDVLDRGRSAYGVSCGFCHGSDANGGSIGPNLRRSDVVLQDKDGELILPITQGSRADRGMPKIDVTQAQVSDIAAWLHSLPVTSRMGHDEKINIVVGNASQGEAAFQRMCATCHSITGDLRGFAAKYSDPRAMQQAWIMPAAPARGPGGAANTGDRKSTRLNSSHVE